MEDISLIYSEDEINKFHKLFSGPFMTYQAVRKKWVSSLTGETKLPQCFKKKIHRSHFHLDIMNVYPKYPKNSQAIYVSINSLDLEKAGVLTINEFINQRLLKTKKKAMDLDKLFLNKAQITPVNRYITLDLDYKNKLDKLIKLLKDNHIIITVIIETNGGYHLIIDTKDLTTPQMKKFIHHSIKSIPVSEDNQEKLICLLKNPYSPLPGTLQGGFKVKINYTKFDK